MKLSTFEALKNALPAGAFYLTDDQLAALQDTLLMMLRELNDIAAAHDIALTLGGGTALGAARHGGFIPWDDDVDLNVPRRDYERLVRLLREEHADEYWVHTPRDTPGYGILTTRVRRVGTVVKQREDDYGDECGATIDLCPIENTYDNAVLRALHGALCMGFGFALSCRKLWRDRKSVRPLLRGDRGAYRLKAAVGFCLSWAGVDFWARAADRVYAMCRNERSKYVVMPAGRAHFFGELYPRATFMRTRRIDFAGVPCAVTAALDDYLTRLYGDWRAEPESDQRERHAYFAFEL